MSSRLGMPATVTVDQQNLVGSNHIGLGEFANIRYRGQVFTPTQNEFSALAFQMVSLGTADIQVFLTDVDQATNLPTGSVLASWTIPNASLSTNLTTYLLTPAYTKLNVGHKYAFYLAPYINNAYSDDYRDMVMSVSGPYAGGPEIANTNGAWSVDPTYDMVFKMGKAAYVTRNAATGRNTAGARHDIIPPYPLVEPTTNSVPRGVAFSGLEFGSAIPGSLNIDYFESSQATYTYFGNKGFNTVRLPFLWERLQPTLDGDLDTTYKGYLDDQITKAANAGLKVILDCHNYGRRNVTSAGGFTSDFSSADVMWKGNYSLASSILSISAYNRASGGSILNPVSGGTYAVTADIRIDSDGGQTWNAAWLELFRTDDNNRYYLTYSVTGGYIQLYKVVAGVQTQLGTYSTALTMGTFNTIVVDVGQTTSNTIIVKLNGTTIITAATDSGLTAGQVALFGNGANCSMQNFTLDISGDTTSGRTGSGYFRIGDTGLTQTNFANLWTKIATAYASNATVYAYDLMNEPHDMPVATTSGNYDSTSTWTLAAQAAIDAIRAVDTTHFIIAELDGWAGGHAFTANYGSSPTPWWTDSASKLVYSFHEYFDNDYSGSYASAFASTNNSNISGDVTPIMSWAQTNSLNLHCGEFGVPNQPDWQVCLTTFLDLCNTYNVWTNHWAAGDVYTSTTTLQPTNSYNTDALQMAIVGESKYLGTLI